MMRLIPFFVLFLTTVGSVPLRPQDRRSAQELLDRALHFADLYNWDDAGEDFAEAEKLFLAAGDERNALYAKLWQDPFDHRPTSPARNFGSARLELEKNPLLQTDKQLRFFCLIVKGDIDGEIDARAMREDWEEVQELAKELGTTNGSIARSLNLVWPPSITAIWILPERTSAEPWSRPPRAKTLPRKVVFLTMLGIGLRESQMNEQASGYFDNALKIASTIPDTEYPFFTKEALLENLIGR